LARLGRILVAHDGARHDHEERIDDRRDEPGTRTRAACGRVDRVQRERAERPRMRAT
jgi:hypothetical protein